MKTAIGWILGLALLAAPAWAEPASQGCAPPTELAGWATRHPVTAATRIGGSPAPELAVGEAVDLALAPIGSLSLAAPLGRDPRPTDHGGLVTFRIALSGTYRIALGDHAWIDVVATGAKPVASIAHAPGPACAGIAKQVDFRLEPGSYALQLSAAEAGQVPVMIVRLP